MAKYQYFRGKCCRIQQPYTSIWEKMTLHYTSVSMCLLSSKTCPKDLFVWTVK